MKTYGGGWSNVSSSVSVGDWGNIRRGSYVWLLNVLVLVVGGWNSVLEGWSVNVLGSIGDSGSGAGGNNGQEDSSENLWKFNKRSKITISVILLQKFWWWQWFKLLFGTYSVHDDS